MSFVKSILQQWRDRNLKKNAAPGHEPLSPADIPGNDIAEQHLLEALARQINDAVANGETITSLNIETTYEQLSESLDRFKQESLNVARNEVSEQWSEEESRRIAEIKNLQQQNAELLQNFTESQKRYAGADRLRKTLSERIHDLENELVTVRNEYEREIEEKLRQINQIKARSLGLAHESDEAPADNEPHEENGADEPEKVFDCHSIDTGNENDTVVIKHRYASLYTKLNKAQNALQEQRKENRNLLKRDSRHRQRIEELVAANQSLRKEVRRLGEELEQALAKIGKRTGIPTTDGNTRNPHRTMQGLTSLQFEEESADDDSQAF